MRFWGITPTAWSNLPKDDRTSMSVHYMEHNLRKSHESVVSDRIAKAKAKSKENK